MRADARLEMLPLRDQIRILTKAAQLHWAEQIAEVPESGPEALVRISDCLNALDAAVLRALKVEERALTIRKGGSPYPASDMIAGIGRALACGESNDAEAKRYRDALALKEEAQKTVAASAGPPAHPLRNSGAVRWDDLGRADRIRLQKLAQQMLVAEDRGNDLAALLQRSGAPYAPQNRLLREEREQETRNLVAGREALYAAIFRAVGVTMPAQLPDPVITAVALRPQEAQGIFTAAALALQRMGGSEAEEITTLRDSVQALYRAALHAATPEIRRGRGY